MPLHRSGQVLGTLALVILAFMLQRSCRLYISGLPREVVRIRTGLHNFLTNSYGSVFSTECIKQETWARKKKCASTSCEIVRRIYYVTHVTSYGAVET
ncbi:uncharacterized protein LOC143246143 isoform X2 [Tachypleus tridentatus]|uniref:uncharacterized protein LOC143246143 isoform X2 n=1 Tax=Tachypleus tridentatus TaxID=6853 RepID=UPI003FD4D547